MPFHDSSERVPSPGSSVSDVSGEEAKDLVAELSVVNDSTFNH